MLDDKTKALIIKYLRKAWLYSPARRQVIKAAETGEKTPEGEKVFYCNHSEIKELATKKGISTIYPLPHPVSKVYVDHKQPMVPLTGFDSFDKLIERLFDVGNMQTLCKLHHNAKSKVENKQRKRRTK